MMINLMERHTGRLTDSGLRRGFGTRGDPNKDSAPCLNPGTPQDVRPASIGQPFSFRVSPIFPACPTGHHGKT